MTSATTSTAPGARFAWYVVASECDDGRENATSDVWTFSSIARFNDSVPAAQDTYVVLSGTGVDEEYSHSEWLYVRSFELSWAKYSYLRFDLGASTIRSKLEAKGCARCG